MKTTTILHEELEMGRPGQEPSLLDSDQLGRIYREGLRSIPYNSISELYRCLGGRTPDVRFGANCGFQAHAIGERAKAAGAEHVSYVMDGRHAAAVCRAQGQLFLIDPYLLHAELIDLSLTEGEAGACFDAYPFLSLPSGLQLRSQLRVRHVARRNLLVLEYLRVNEKTLTRTLQRYFQLRLDQPVMTPPPLAQLTSMLFHPEQNNLSVRVLSVAEGTLSDLVYPICYYHGGPAPAAEHLIIRAANGQILEHRPDGLFQEELIRMADLLGVTPDALVDFVVEGAVLYERHAPRHIDYHPYPAYRPLHLQPCA